ncbi:MAG: hypothetical protein LQ341_002105 [Variospora aurantia]|nr:MAG: hypothetical protein LQ341_002105 [Variospora aurantia]
MATGLKSENQQAKILELADGTSASPASPASLGTNLRIWRTFSVALAISRCCIDKISEIERQTLRALSAEVILRARSKFYEQM